MAVAPILPLLKRCQGCDTVIVKIGVVADAGYVPTSGRTIYCPKCGCSRVYDATRYRTSAAHAFTPAGDYLGKMVPGEHAGPTEPPGGKPLEPRLEKCHRCPSGVFLKFGGPPAPLEEDGLRRDQKQYRCAVCDGFLLDGDGFTSTRVHCFGYGGAYVCEM